MFVTSPTDGNLDEQALDSIRNSKLDPASFGADPRVFPYTNPNWTRASTPDKSEGRVSLYVDPSSDVHYLQWTDTVTGRFVTVSADSDVSAGTLFDWWVNHA
jgi:hypothetical protein